MSQDDFRVPASDAQGHSVKQFFRCTPGHERQMAKHVTGGKFPYRSKSDLIRHALARHLRWLDDHGDSEIASVTRQVDAILEIVKDDEYYGEFKLAMQRLKERVSIHIADGAHNEARRLVMAVQEQVALMPEGFWQDKYEKVLKQEFGSFINSGRQKLGKLEKEDIDV